MKATIRVKAKIWAKQYKAYFIFYNNYYFLGCWCLVRGLRIFRVQRSPGICSRKLRLKVRTWEHSRMLSVLSQVTTLTWAKWNTLLYLLQSNAVMLLHVQVWRPEGCQAEGEEGEGAGALRLQRRADRGLAPHPLPGEYSQHCHSSTFYSFTIAFLINPFHTFEIHHKPFTRN